jgi:cytochrome c-type biogenesis protein CcmH/NrfG
VEALLIASPGSPDLLCLRGNCLAAVGNNVGVGAPAPELLHTLQNSHAACAPMRAVQAPRQPQCMLIQCAKCQLQGASIAMLHMQAFASFASALAADGGHLETLMSCGRLYKSCGLLVESVESYRAAHTLGPGSLDASRALAVVLTDLGAGVGKSAQVNLVVLHAAGRSLQEPLSAMKLACWIATPVQQAAWCCHD